MKSANDRITILFKMKPQHSSSQISGSIGSQKPKAGGQPGQPAVFKAQGPQPLRKLQGVKTYPQGQVPPESFLPLEKVIGLSSRGSTSIAVNPVTGDVAYPAGAIICIYSPKENKQTKFLYSQELQRSYSCLSYSGDGRYLSAGEGAFRQPEITIWEIDQGTGDYQEIKHLKGHKYGIESVMFSPNMLYLISLGDANDRGLFVWDWRTEQRVTSNKLGKPVNNFAFAKSSTFFVTAGYQHLKYWYFDEEGRIQKPIGQQAQPQQESIMESKSADLTKVKLKIFVGVVCVANGGASGKEEQVLALASDGHLYVYDKNRKLTKWMNIKVERALSCAIGGTYLYCSCTEGIVRLFNSKTLEHIITLPKPPPLGQANVESGKKIRIPSSKESKFADAIAVLVDEINQRALVLYSDKMIFIWDMHVMDKISVYRTLYSHCGPIYDMQYVPNSLSIGFQPQQSEQQILNEDEMQAITKIATCSSDRTIRFWTFVDPSAQLSNQSVNKVVVKNAYCKDMSRMIYVSSETRDGNGELASPQSFFDQFKSTPITLNEDGTPKQDDPKAQLKDLEQLRCIRISPDGKHLACGDWRGNIRIHDISNNQNATYEELQCIQAHDSEVVCLDYSPLVKEGESQHVSRFWLASGSRDRLTQIYEYNAMDGGGAVEEYQYLHSYQNVAILDDHSSTITSIKFAEEKSTNQDTNSSRLQNCQTYKKRLKLISSGADKQIVVRTVIPGQIAGESQPFQAVLTSKEPCKSKVFSMDVTCGHAVTGHDKYLQLWTASGGFDKEWERRAESSKKQAVLDHLRVSFGPLQLNGEAGCDIVLASSADKTVTMYETATGNAVCKTTCGEVTLAMSLSTNLKHLITASMDGIIYIWKLPEAVTKALLKLRAEPPPLPKGLVLKAKVIPAITNLNLIQDESIEDSTANQNNKSDEFDFNIPERKTSSDDKDQASQDVDDSQRDSVMDESQQMVDQHPTSISMIMQQINKVADQIDKIQPLRGRGGHLTMEDAQQEQPLFSPPKPLAVPQKEDGSNSSTPVQLKRRNPWGASGAPLPIAKSPPHSDIEHQDDLETTAEQQQRLMQVQEKKLPRWAQSVAGDSAFAYNKQGGSNITTGFRNEDDDDDIEDVFQNTLERVAEEPKSVAQGVSKDIFYGGGSGTESHGQVHQEEESKVEHKVSPQKLLDEDPPEDSEDPDELLIKEQLRIRKRHHQQLLGLLEDDDDDDKNHFQDSRNQRLSEDVTRQSQSQLFFQRKKDQQQESDSGKQQQLHVEDIFEYTLAQPVAVSINTSPVEKLQQSPCKVQQPCDPDFQFEDSQSIVLSSTPQQVVKKAALPQSESAESLVQLKLNETEEIGASSIRINESASQDNLISETVKEELEKINQSLARISLCMNKQGNSSLREDVNESLGKSLELWNSVAQTIGGARPGSTLPMQTQSSVNSSTFNHMMLPSQQQRGNTTSMGDMSQIGGSSMLSMVSIKEDARDLLEKYSDLLMAEVLKKLSK